MPSKSPSETMQLLARKKPVSWEESVQLLRLRRDRLKPHLRDASLQRLGNQIKLYGRGRDGHRLRDDKPQIRAASGDGLSLAGYFCDIQRGETAGYDPHTWSPFLAWGILVDGDLVSVTVSYLCDPKKGEVAQTVAIQRCSEDDLPQGLSPLRVASGLTDLAQRIAQRRRELLAPFEELADDFAREDALLATIA